MLYYNMISIFLEKKNIYIIIKIIFYYTLFLAKAEVHYLSINIKMDLENYCSYLNGFIYSNRIKVKSNILYKYILYVFIYETLGRGGKGIFTLCNVLRMRVKDKKKKRIYLNYNSMII